MKKHQLVTIYLVIFLFLAFGLKLIGVINIDNNEILAFLMIIFGISYVFITFGADRKVMLFSSTVIFLTGIIVYLLNSFEFIGIRVLIYPIFLFVLGIAFLMVYVDGGMRLIYLIVSGVLLLSGGLLTAIKGDFKGGSFFASLIAVAASFWPVIIIVLIVFLLILRGEYHERKNSNSDNYQ